MARDLVKLGKDPRISRAFVALLMNHAEPLHFVSVHIYLQKQESMALSSLPVVRRELLWALQQAT